MIVYSISDYSGALIIIYSKCCKSYEIIQSSKRSHLSSIEAKDVFLDSDDFRESSDMWESDSDSSGSKDNDEFTQ